MIVLAGGEVLTADGWVEADVTIDAGRVIGVGGAGVPAMIVDATGCLVGPGFVDLHAHLREPGQRWKEDISTGSAAAAAGGFTAVIAMPNTDPPIDSVETAMTVIGRGQEVGLVEVVPAGSLTAGRRGQRPAELEGLYELGIRLFTDDGDSVDDDALLRRIMGTLSALPGAVLAQHPEAVDLSAGGHLNEGEASRATGVGGLPVEAEVEVVRRDLRLAEETGARYHVQHVSAGMTLELIREAKGAGLAVTAEVTPHHLTFDESSVLGLDPNFKMYPPLRSEIDRKLLVEALRDGTVDAVATDHAPHAAAEKEAGFVAAPRGVIGLETAASAVWEATGDRDLFFRCLSIAPALIAGLGHQGRVVGPGEPANLVVFDPAATWTCDRFRSKSANSPYLGRAMTGRVQATVCQGRLVYHDGSVVG